jgi:dTDP-glucose 4,6-dehydratase
MKVVEWRLDRSGVFDGDFARLRDKAEGLDLDGHAVLLTGGTGFFGLWLVEFFDWLRREKRMDIAVYALSRAPERVLSQRPIYWERPWLRLFEGDVRAFEPPVDHVDCLVHGATDTSADASARALDMFDVIFAGTRRALGVAARVHCRRVLLISSGAVYGSIQSPGRIAETCGAGPDTMLPSSAYGEGKRMGEALGTFMAQQAPLEVVAARCFAFVGAGLPLSAHFAIGNFIRDASEDRDLLLNSTGASQRSYLYAADMAVWLTTMLLKGRAGAAYNVGSDRAVDIHAAACLVRDVLAPSRSVRIADNASTKASYYVPDIERARDELGLDVWTPLEFAIRRTAEDAKLFGPFRERCE